jgi:hypothetical protein
MTIKLLKPLALRFMYASCLSCVEISDSCTHHVFHVEICSIPHVDICNFPPRLLPAGPVHADDVFHVENNIEYICLTSSRHSRRLLFQSVPLLERAWNIIQRVEVMLSVSGGRKTESQLSHNTVSSFQTSVPNELYEPNQKCTTSLSPFHCI